MKQLKHLAFLGATLMVASLASCSSTTTSTNSSVSGDSVSESTSTNIGTLKSISAVYSGNPKIGDVLDYKNDLVVTATYANGQKILTDSDYSINKLSSPSLDMSYSLSSPFKSASTYSYTVKYRTKSTTFSTDVDSLVGTSNSLTSLVVDNNQTYPSNVYLLDVASLTLTLQWTAGVEYLAYSSSLSSYFNFKLYKSTDLSTDVIASKLVTNTHYVLRVTYIYGGQSKYGDCNFDCETGYVQPTTLKYKYTDIDEYAPALGSQKVLIVPVVLKNCTDYSFTTSILNNINTYYFGEKSATPNQWNSLKTYYETASYNKIQISGAVAQVYTSPTIAKTDLSDWGYNSMSNLFAVIEAALSSAKNDIFGNAINLDEYDSDNNGYIDSFHVILNASDGNSNDNCIWPHMASTGATRGSQSQPTANVYSASNLGHVSASDGGRTSVHEQGHIFGLMDYYNYAYDNSDFVGYMDMQSYNVMDWNPFSKMSIGWATKPYVVDGSQPTTTISIKPFATTGEAIVIPANYSSWNGSAFDEYIIVEFFAKVGNNSDPDWSYWNNICSNHDGGRTLSKNGVRIYHVDGRLISNSGVIIDNSHPLSNYSSASLACSNSTGDYGSSVYPNYKLLQVMQAGNVNTFASTSSSVHHYFSDEDLFQANDTFTVGVHSGYTNFGPNFFYNTTKFDNGLTFPYGIKINNVGSESASITITKF